MTILSGRFRSRKINTNPDFPYRPTKARVRKSLFDSLIPYKYERVLDLFSGSGILGFEAASRGSNSITFVENNHRIMSLLKQNAHLLTGPEYTFIQKNVFNYIKIPSVFDLIFADPPYKKYELSTLIEKVSKLLDDGGKFILECTKDQEPVYGAKIVDYGKSRLLTWEKI